MTVLYPEPVPGIPIVEPETIPRPDDVLVGYEVVRPHKLGFLTKPKPKRMNIVGWVAVAAATVLFFPVMCVPCCMSFSYSDYQRPVYRPSPFSSVARSVGAKGPTGTTAETTGASEITVAKDAVAPSTAAAS